MEQWSPIFLAPATGFMEDDLPTDPGWVGETVQAVKSKTGVTDEASLICLPLTSCCVAQFLTGCRLAHRSMAWGLGPSAMEDPQMRFLLRL